MARMPHATVDVTAAVVRRLIRQQRPDLAGRSVVRIANGWDNATFRLGGELAVRLPRRPEAVPLIGTARGQGTVPAGSRTEGAVGGGLRKPKRGTVRP